MPEKTVNINVRFPESVRDRVKSFSQLDRRSMNSEILALLEEAMNAREAGRRPQSRMIRCAEESPGYDPAP